MANKEGRIMQTDTDELVVEIEPAESTAQRIHTPRLFVSEKCLACRGLRKQAAEALLQNALKENAQNDVVCFDGRLPGCDSTVILSGIYMVPGSIELGEDEQFFDDMVATEGSKFRTSADYIIEAARRGITAHNLNELR